MENNLPIGWIKSPPFEISEKIRGVSYNKDEISFMPNDGLIPVMRANNIEDNNLVYKDLVYVPMKSISVNQLLKEGDVVIAMSSGSKNLVGKTAQFNDDVKISFGAFCGALRPSKELNSKYFGYYFQTKEYRNIISALSAGTNINNLKNEYFAALQIPIAPLPEQHRIVTKLDALFEKIESNKERLEKIPKLLKRFRQSVLAAAVSGKLTEEWRKENKDVESAEKLLSRISKRCISKIKFDKTELDSEDYPSDWKVTQLGRISQLITKGASPNWQGIKYTSKGVLFITSENVGNNHLILDNKKYVQEEFNTIQKRSILQRGDLLTNIVGASIGRTAIFNLSESSNINQAVCLIRLYEELSKEYYCFVLNSPKLIDVMNSEKVDVARANISLNDVNNYPVPLPTLEEQKEIVHKVKQLFSYADKIESRYTNAKALLDKLPQSILAKAFRGELVTQDPNDEPASVLLERIWAEKRILKEHRKGKRSNKKQV